MSDVTKCPNCGAALPPDAPAGLCPACLVRAGARGGPASSKLDAPTAPSPASVGFSPPLVEELATRFPELEILALLGYGGMGAVYKARQRGLDRLVALKILPVEIGADPTFSERFAREARALAKLSHQHIVPVYDFGQKDGLYYLLMEYVDGTNLRQLIEAQEMQPSEALAIVPQICEALQFAHDEGIVHRDIKPENILVDQRGRVKIADFGLAKLAAPKPEDFTITATHQVMGTPRYMAPEQMERSHSVDHRADIYSLGVVFYEMLTGEVPAGHFDPPSQKVEVDVRLDEVVLRAMARDPNRRYQRASEVRTDVESISLSHPHGVADEKAEPTGMLGAEAAAATWQAHANSAGAGEFASAANLSKHGGRDWVTLSREQVENDRLPNCCIVCGTPTHERLNKNFEHTPDWAAILGMIGVFAGLFPGIIIFALTTHTIRVACPVCPEHRATWKKLFWVACTGWLAIPLLGLVGFGVAYVIGRGELTPAGVVPAVVIGVLVGLIAYVAQLVRLSQSSIHVAFITKHEIRFEKVSAAFARGAAELARISNSGGKPRQPERARPAFFRRTIVGQAWDSWWAERDRWFANAVQTALFALFLLSQVAFFSYQMRHQASLQEEGRTPAHTKIEFGFPNPWFQFEENPDQETAFAYRINWFASSVGISMIGFIMYGAFWQIEKAKAAAAKKRLRVWDGSPQFIGACWAAAVIVAISWGMHPLYLDLTPSLDSKLKPTQEVTEERAETEGVELDVSDEDSPLTQLLQAARHGNVSDVKRLLDEGVYLNDKDTDGKTALMEAAAGGHASLAATLVLLGGNVNERDARGRTALIHAAENGHSAVLDALRKLQDAANEDPPEERHKRIRQLAGIDWRLLANQDRELARLEIDYHAQDDTGQTAQMKAAVRGNVEWFRALSRGAIGATLIRDDRRQDVDGRTMLMHAIANNQKAVIECLTEADRNPLISIFLDPITDRDGRTALQLADELDLEEIANLIRSHVERDLIQPLNNLIESSIAIYNPQFFEYRGRAWDSLGESEKAAADFERAKQMLQRPTEIEGHESVGGDAED